MDLGQFLKPASLAEALEGCPVLGFRLPAGVTVHIHFSKQRLVTWHLMHPKGSDHLFDGRLLLSVINSAESQYLDIHELLLDLDLVPPCVSICDRKLGRYHCTRAQ